MQTILKSSSISETRSAELHVNNDKSTVYVGLFDKGELISHFTTTLNNWKDFILLQALDHKVL